MTTGIIGSGIQEPLTAGKRDLAPALMPTGSTGMESAVSPPCTLAMDPGMGCMGRSVLLWGWLGPGHARTRISQLLSLSFLSPLHFPPFPLFLLYLYSFCLHTSVRFCNAPPPLAPSPADTAGPAGRWIMIGITVIIGTPIKCKFWGGILLRGGDENTLHTLRGLEG